MEIIMKKKIVHSSRKWIDLCLMQWRYYFVPLSESDFVQHCVKSSDFYSSCQVFSLCRADSLGTLALCIGAAPLFQCTDEDFVPISGNQQPSISQS